MATNIYQYQYNYTSDTQSNQIQSETNMMLDKTPIHNNSNFPSFSLQQNQEKIHLSQSIESTTTFKKRTLKQLEKVSKLKQCELSENECTAKQAAENSFGKNSLGQSKVLESITSRINDLQSLKKNQGSIIQHTKNLEEHHCALYLAPSDTSSVLNDSERLLCQNLEQSQQRVDDMFQRINKYLDNEHIQEVHGEQIHDHIDPFRVKARENIIKAQSFRLMPTNNSLLQKRLKRIPSSERLSTFRQMLLKK